MGPGAFIDGYGRQSITVSIVGLSLRPGKLSPSLGQRQEKEGDLISLASSSVRQSSWATRPLTKRNLSDRAVLFPSISAARQHEEQSSALHVNVLSFQ